MKILDNFLKESEFIHLRDVVENPTFLWEYNPNTATDDDPENLKYKGEHLVPILVNAIKELSAENTALKNLIKNSSSFAALKSSL